MPIAAVPEYLGNDFCSASPALRFGMYLKLWGVDSRSKRNLWTTHDVNYRETGRDRQERRFKDDNKTSALDAATRLSEIDRKSIAAHVQRQRAIFDAAAGADGLELMAKSVAPFTTGLGNEHPLENGFAFLNPYGLPYLPGSGVKGVVRRSAEELAHSDFFQGGSGWTLPAIWHLFGFEPWLTSASRKSDTEWDKWIGGFPVDKEKIAAYLDAVLDENSAAHKKLKCCIRKYDEPMCALRALLEERQLHVRGALEFWDAVPQIKGNRLAVEIMTPHQSHYYQSKAHAGSTSPHDSGKPTPISFLTVPPGSDFFFHVRCDHRRLARCAPELAADDRWRTLLKAAFEHAFEWLGFGAKTAIGYGTMKRDHTGEQRSLQERENRERATHEQAERERAEREAEAQEERRLAALSPVEREIESIVSARKDKNMLETIAVMQAVRDGRWGGAAKIEAARWLENKMKDEKRWRERSTRKKPDKDKDYQNTLLVKDWLEGK